MSDLQIPSEARPSPFPHSLCWNARSRGKVTNTLALDVLPEVFHATHSPTQLAYGRPGDSALRPTTETKFLDDFLDPEKDRRLAFIVGDSGAGKSHLIRWAYFEIEKRNRKEQRFHVRLIPRSSSNLHDVILRLLEGFDEVSLVQSIKHELELARSKLTEKGARARVLDELAFVLEEGNVSQRPGARELSMEEEEVQELIPAFLRDDAVRNWLLSEVDLVAKLGDHIGGHRENIQTEPEDLLWTGEDLMVPVQLQNDIGKRGRELAGLLIAAPTFPPMTARLLNHAWSAAYSALLGLRQGNLGKALEEIREVLQGKDLVLLIEDLSITKGVDFDLLESLIIPPNEIPGKTLCTLRSMVGLTPDDYRSLPTNVQSEARSYPVTLTLPIGKSEEGSVSHEDLVRFASRYLNAARFPLETLKQWADDEDARQTSLPSFCDASECPNRSNCHEAFGAVSPDEQTGEYGLYPFTSESLIRLYGTLPQAKDASTGDLTFNPRAMVGSVLNRVMELAERDLSDGRFPNDELTQLFDLHSVSAEAQIALEQKYSSDYDRALSAVEMYSPTRGDLDTDIARALGFSVDESEPVIKKPEPIIDEPVIVTHEPVKVAPTIDVFDQWANGGHLEDQDRPHWQKAVYEAVCAVIDWDLERGAYPLKHTFKNTHVHFEGQRPSTKRGDVRLLIKRSARTAVALRALTTLHRARATTAEMHEALLRCQDWIEEQANEVRRQFDSLHAHVEASKPSAIEYAAVLMGLSSMIRGVASPTTEVTELLNLCFEDWSKEKVSPHRQSAWKTLWQKFQTHSPKVRDWLKSWIACTKGASEQMGLLDPSPMLESLRQVKSAKIPSLPKESDRWPEKVGIHELAATLEQSWDVALREEKEYCREWLTEVEQWLDGRTPREVLANVDPVLTLASGLGLLRGAKARDLDARIQSMKSKALKKCLDLAKGASEADNDKTLLTHLCRRDATLMHDFRELLRDIGTVLSNSQDEIRSRLQALSNDDRAMDQSRDRIREQLSNLRDSLKKLWGDDE